MKIAFIGAGNMASAIINSIVSSGRIAANAVYVYDKFDEKSAELSKRLGVIKCDTLADAVNSCDTILLAVKPQDYEALLTDISANCVEVGKKVFISIAAAISCDYICSVLKTECPVIRVMPNTPLLLGVGATAISRNSLVTDKVYSAICTIFASSGSVCSLDEQLMNKVISVNGSSPVYLYMLAKSMIEKSVEYGISEKYSRELVYQTLLGSVEMLRKSGKSPDELIKMVASPGGTTLAAISSMNDDGFDTIMKKAMDACTARAEELSK